MKKLLLTIALFLLAQPSHAANISFVTESYPPYSFTADNGEPAGVGVELVHSIMESLNGEVSYTIDIMPWARAQALAETKPDHCMFAAARTPEREDDFSWVTPFFTDVNWLVARQDANIPEKDIAALRKYNVGTQRGDFTEELLQARGFRRVDVGTTFDTNLLKLLAGRIDLMPMSESVFDKLVREGSPLRKVAPFAEQKLGIACNKKVSGRWIARMQAALDTMRASGQQDAILLKYGLRPVR